MKIIQSFWSAGKDVYADGFGWKHPELHFMSWALSCLSLREHYDDVTLYTDSAGYDVLINKLRLPYTRVEVCFDNLKCLPRYWGYTKILAYARQSEPFVYIDSDIYLPRPLPKRLERATLVAQNREYGTAYYKSMTNDMLSRPGLRIPPELYDGVAAESVASYNMGLFGGRDTAFIRRFCDTVFRFMDDNDLHNPLGKNSTANCNLVMEQIFFAVMADNEHRKVEGIVPRTMRDNGYTRGVLQPVALRKEPLFPPARRPQAQRLGVRHASQDTAAPLPRILQAGNGTLPVAQYGRVCGSRQFYPRSARAVRRVGIRRIPFPRCRGMPRFAATRRVGRRTPLGAVAHVPRPHHARKAGRRAAKAQTPACYRPSRTRRRQRGCANPKVGRPSGQRSSRRGRVSAGRRQRLERGAFGRHGLQYNLPARPPAHAARTHRKRAALLRQGARANNEAEARVCNARGRTPRVRRLAHGGRLTHSRCALRCNPSDLLRLGCVVRYSGVGTADFTTNIARVKDVNIHFPGCVKRLGFFTRFCVFVAGCAKG